MKQKSKSYRQLRQAPYPLYNDYSAIPSLNYNSRLAYPKVGDSRFYLEVGKRHYENQSDRMLRIILPEKYAREKLLIRRERSVPPHLQAEFSQRLYNVQAYQSSKHLSPKPAVVQNIKNRVQDELDKMKDFFEKKKVASPEREGKIGRDLDRRQNGRKATISLSENQSLLSPSLKSSAAQRTSVLLYNPENKPIYDRFDLARSKNPTHLSTGLSII